MKVCNVCGNNIEDNIKFCPFCGNQVLGNNSNPNMVSHPIYNNSNQQYQQYQQVPNYQQNGIQNQQYYQPNQMYNQQAVPNKAKTSEIIGAIASSIGLFYAFSLFSVLMTGVDKFINERLVDPKYEVLKDSPGAMAFGMTWVSLIAGTVALIIGLKNNKQVKKGINTYNIIGGVISLLMSVITIIAVFNVMG